MKGIANWSTGAKNNRIETNKMKSVTVPDKTLTLRDLINRHQSGGRVKSFTPVYLGDNNLIPMGFERLDLTERAEIAKALPEFIAAGRGRLMTLRQSIEKAEREYLAQKKREEFLALKQEFEPSTTE